MIGFLYLWLSVLLKMKKCDEIGIYIKCVWSYINDIEFFNVRMGVKDVIEYS